MQAFIFTGQGSQFIGMGKELYERSEQAQEFFERANTILGYRLTDIMFEGDPATLKQTKYAQPAIYTLSVVIAKTTREFKPDISAGHSLGEISALAACRALSFGDGLRLVQKRADAMQKALEATPSTMAAVIGIDDNSIIEEICASMDEIVVPANYNSPGQLVISGTVKGIEEVGPLLVEAGARRCITLNVAGAYHSPIMEPAIPDYKDALDSVVFREPICPIYQNFDALPSEDPEEIKEKLFKQITAPVKWEETIRNMSEDGARHFYEMGPRTVLASMVRKITGREITTVLDGQLTTTAQ